uniref:Uncharacterized protein n=1 Tax=Balaenoptera musculus TaxID=9771 RepID=A0A8C0C5Z4_BALMU
MAKAASGSYHWEDEDQQSLPLQQGEYCRVPYFEEPLCVTVHIFYVFERNWSLLSTPTGIFLSITDTLMTTRPQQRLNPHHAAHHWALLHTWQGDGCFG